MRERRGHTNARLAYGMRLAMRWMKVDAPDLSEETFDAAAAARYQVADFREFVAKIGAPPAQSFIEDASVPTKAAFRGKMEERWARRNRRINDERLRRENLAPPDQGKLPAVAEVIRYLEHLESIFGYPTFGVTIAAIRALGLDTDSAPFAIDRARTRHWGDDYSGLVVQMSYAVNAWTFPVVMAAQYVAGNFGAPGASFDAAVKGLRNAYKRQTLAHVSET